MTYFYICTDDIKNKVKYINDNIKILKLIEAFFFCVFVNDSEAGLNLQTILLNCIYTLIHE